MPVKRGEEGVAWERKVSVRRLASTSQPNTQKRKLAMNKEKIENVIRFLEENDQYGDDSTAVIYEFKKLITCN